jgi:hypothetical protein
LWEKQSRDVSSVAATIPWSIDWYTRNLRFIFDLKKKCNNLIIISYEDLKISPFVTMSIVLRWLSIPINQTYLMEAVCRSDGSVVRAEEQRRDEPILGGTFGGGFVRDGSVGQWKHELTAEHVNKVEEILGRYGFSLMNFVTELPQEQQSEQNL